MWAQCRTLSGSLPWEATPADKAEGIIICWKLEWLLMFQESLRYRDLNSGPKICAFLARILRSVGSFHKSVGDACILIRPADICQGRPALNGLLRFGFGTESRVSLALQAMASDAAKDLISGTAGGAAQLIVGHPFDTIKVKLQSQPVPAPGQKPMYSGAIDAVKQTLSAEGPRGLFKGMGAPLASVAAFNAVLFTARGQMESLFRTEPSGVQPLSVGQQFICGAGAGVAVSFLACPTELIKCRLQAQSALASSGSVGVAAAAAIGYNGPIDVAKHVLRSEGGFLGLFKGLVPTFSREIPGNAAAFGAYEAVKQFIAGGRDTSQLSRLSLLTAGGIAGAAFWMFVYPTDVIKSVIQVDDYKQPKYRGMLDAFKKIKASEGIKGFYKGFAPAMARSVPANAVCFLVYEVARSSLG